MAKIKRVNIVIYDEDYQRLKKRMIYGDSFASAVKQLLDLADKDNINKVTTDLSKPMVDTTLPETS